MLNIFAVLKSLVITALISVTTLTRPHVNTPVHPQPQTANYVSQASTDSDANFYNITGTYSYLDQKIEYSVSIPKAGGNFQGTITGLCSGSIHGSYSGSINNKISGQASGQCKLPLKNFAGTTNFSGTIDPNNYKIQIQFDNLPTTGPVTIFYQ